MNIYPSTKVKPYVYIGIHKITGEIYIGYREKNVKLNRPSHLDIFEYRTSSNKVKERFNEFNWFILAEFFTGDAAWDFEQQLIYENWHNKLLLNENCHYGKGRFKCNTSGYKHTEKTLNKMKEKFKTRAPNRKGARLEKELKNKLRQIRINGIKNGTILVWNKGKKQSENLSCPHCDIICQAKWTFTRYHGENCKYKKAE